MRPGRRDLRCAPGMKRRTCQPCTACCDGWVKMTIEGVPVSPGHPCPHSTPQGCDNYANRPVDPCVNFACGWIIPQSPLPDWMKPDNARVIVLFAKFHWQGAPVDLAVPVGRRVPPRALVWLRNFAETQRRPLIHTEQVVEGGRFQGQQRWFGHGPEPFLRDLVRWQGEGRSLWT